MDDSFFDINLDFFEQPEIKTTKISNVKLDEFDSSSNTGTNFAYNFEEIAARISNVDALVRQIKCLQDERADLRKRLEEFNQSAQSIQSLYELEKSERIKLKETTEKLDKKCNDLDRDLINKIFECDQYASQVTEEKGPITYNQLALKFLRLTGQLEEEIVFTPREKQLTQELHEYVKSKGLHLPPPLKKKTRMLKKHNIIELPPIPVKVETISRYTQYVSSTTTRGTSTSVFIKTHSIGTNFPEASSLPSITESLDNIFNEMISKKRPISPIADLILPKLPLPPKETKNIGTLTNLYNVRKPIDYSNAHNNSNMNFVPQIKRSTSRPPSRNMHENIKNEAYWQTLNGFNPFMGASMPEGYINGFNQFTSPINAAPMSSPGMELWNLLGQTIFLWMQNQNRFPFDPNRNINEHQNLNQKATNYCQEFGKPVEERIEKEAESRNNSGSMQSCYQEETRSSCRNSDDHVENRNIGTSPIPFPCDNCCNCFENQKSSHFNADAIAKQSFENENISMASEILKLFPESQNSTEKLKAIHRLLKHTYQTKSKLSSKKRAAKNYKQTTAIDTSSVVQPKKNYVKHKTEPNAVTFYDLKSMQLIQDAQLDTSHKRKLIISHHETDLPCKLIRMDATKERSKDAIETESDRKKVDFKEHKKKSSLEKEIFIENEFSDFAQTDLNSTELNINLHTSSPLKIRNVQSIIRCEKLQNFADEFQLQTDAQMSENLEDERQQEEDRHDTVINEKALVKSVINTTLPSVSLGVITENHMTSNSKNNNQLNEMIENTSINYIYGQECDQTVQTSSDSANISNQTDEEVSCISTETGQEVLAEIEDKCNQSFDSKETQEISQETFASYNQDEKDRKHGLNKGIFHKCCKHTSPGDEKNEFLVLSVEEIPIQNEIDRKQKSNTNHKLCGAQNEEIIVQSASLESKPEILEYSVQSGDQIKPSSEQILISENQFLYGHEKVDDLDECAEELFLENESKTIPNFRNKSEEMIQKLYDKRLEGIGSNENLETEKTKQNKFEGNKDRNIEKKPESSQICENKDQREWIQNFKDVPPKILNSQKSLSSNELGNFDLNKSKFTADKSDSLQFLEIQQVFPSCKKKNSIGTSFKTPERPTTRNRRLSSIGHSTFLTDILSTSPESFSDSISESPDEKDDFENFLNTILEEVCPRLSPISVIASSENGSETGESETETKTCDELITNGQKRRKRIKATPISTPKRSERLQAKRHALENMYTTTSHIEIGKYTKRKLPTVSQPKIQTRIQSKTNTELKIEEPIKPIHMGFFKEREIGENIDDCGDNSTEEDTAKESEGKEIWRDSSIDVRSKDEFDSLDSVAKKSEIDFNSKHSLVPQTTANKFEQIEDIKKSPHRERVKPKDEFEINSNYLPTFSLDSNSNSSQSDKVKVSCSYSPALNFGINQYSETEQEDCCSSAEFLPANCFSDSPASPSHPQSIDNSEINNRTKIIPLRLQNEEDISFFNSSILSRLIKDYNIKHHRAITVQNFSAHKTSIIDKLRLEIKWCIDQDENSVDYMNVVNNLRRLTSNTNFIANAIIEEIDQEFAAKKCNGNSNSVQIIDDKSLRIISELISCLESIYSKMVSTFLLSVEKNLFTLSSLRKDVNSVMNLTKLYLETVKRHQNENNKNPARLFICKSIYFYKKLSAPMIYETLCYFPTVLPHRENRTYDRSDSLINTIQHILMNRNYDMDNLELKHRELLSKLRYEYHFEPYKPQREELIENLIAKIRANKCQNVSYSFALLCKRMQQEAIEKNILQMHLLPLANEYYLLSSSNQTIENNEQISCVLDTISIIIKAFTLDTDITLYTSLFSRFLNGSDRQEVQESALQALLRLTRFGYVSCFNEIYSYKANHNLKPTTKAMLKTFIYKQKLTFLQRVEKQATEMAIEE